VNYYHSQIGMTFSIGHTYQSFERVIEINEVLIQEFNYDYSENFKINIVFTDIDEYGIKIIINKMIYEIEVSYIYNGINLSMLVMLMKCQQYLYYIHYLLNNPYYLYLSLI